MSKWLVYFILKLDDFIKSAVGVLMASSILSIISIILYMVGHFVECVTIMEMGGMCAKYSILVVIISLIAVTFLPKTKDMVVIYLLPKIANNEYCSQIPANIAKLFDGSLQTLASKVAESE